MQVYVGGKVTCMKSFGEKTYITLGTGEIKLFNWREFKIVAVGSIHKEMHVIDGMDFTDTHVYTGGWDHRIFRYDIETLQPDSHCLFYICEDDPTIAERDSFKSLCISPNRKYLFHGTADGEIFRWELPEYNELKQSYIVPHISKKVVNKFVLAMINLPTSLIIFGGSDKKIQIVDYEFKLLMDFELNANVQKLYWRDDKLWIITADKELSVWELPGKLFGEPNDISAPTLLKKWTHDCYINDVFVSGNYKQDGLFIGDWKFRLFKLTWQDVEYKQEIPCGAEEIVTCVEVCDHLITKGDLKKVCKMIVYGAADQYLRRIFRDQADRDEFMDKKIEESSEINLDTTDEEDENRDVDGRGNRQKDYDELAHQFGPK